MAFPYRTHWNGRDFTYVRCAACRATYVDPLPTDSELAAMYASESYHDRHYPEIRPERYRASAVLLRRWSGGRRKLLDFGCGNGSFLVAAAAAGFDCVGIEYEPSAIEGARRTGIPVYDLEAVRSSGQRFEIIHLGDVLEHLADPYGTMRSLGTLLAPNGILFVEGPLQSNMSLVYFASVASKRLRRLLGPERPSSVPPTHLVLAGRSAQAAFLTRRLGYRLLHFDVYETGWPYRVEGARPRSGAALVKYAIGLVAVLVSRVRLGGWPTLGNRFRALLAPGSSARTR
ncbi:MAG: class I SAM-dependent methyltransferase [Elusimicrobia bacterium]|nr:class I SAM-dependent methyltransferase [Elusimicrobiota bacterium]